MSFQIREGQVNVIAFENYGFALVINWQENEPTFRIVEFEGTMMADISGGSRIPVRGIISQSTVDWVVDNILDAFLKRLGSYRLFSAIEATGITIGELRLREELAEIQMRGSSDYLLLFTEDFAED